MTLQVNIVEGGLGRLSANYDNYAALWFDLTGNSYEANYRAALTTLTRPEDSYAFIEAIGAAQTTPTQSDLDIMKANVDNFFRLSPNGVLLVGAGSNVDDIKTGACFDLFRIENNKIRLFGVYSVEYELSQGIISDMQANLNSLFSDYYLSTRCVYYSGGINTITADTPLITSNRVQVLGFTENEDNAIADYDYNGNVGLTLGQLTNYPIHQKQSWREHKISGSVEFVKTDLVDGETEIERTPAIIAGYDTAGICIAGAQTRLTGTYFLNSRMAVDTADDYAIMTHGRVIDKAISLTVDALLPKLDSPAYVATDTGKLSAETIKLFTQLAYDSINNNMVAGKTGDNVELSTDSATGALSQDSVYIDPDQNILSTEQLTIEIRLTPVGATKSIVVNIGLSNPSN